MVAMRTRPESCRAAHSEHLLEAPHTDSYDALRRIAFARFEVDGRTTCSRTTATTTSTAWYNVE